MTTFLNLLMITTIVCFIVDLSGIVNSVKRLFLRKIKINADPSTLTWKPFDCSLCMTFWCGLIYLFLSNNFSILNILMVSLFSFFSSNISGFLSFIKDFLATIETKLSKLNIIK